MKIIYSFLSFVLMITATCGCRKFVNPVAEDNFVELYPEDSSYKSGGCFQLNDANYIIYGFDPSHSGLLPLIIKTDTHGDTLWQRKLPSQFHYVTIKKTVDGNMLAVGAPDLLSDTLYVCKIYSSGEMDSVWPYHVEDIRAGNNYRPDFVEDPSTGDFIITGYGHNDFTNRPQPFILNIDNSGQIRNFISYFLCDTGLNTVSICSNADGYSICGSVAVLPKGIFYLKVGPAPQFIPIWDTILLDPVVSINAYAITGQTSGDSTIVCCFTGGDNINGKLFTLKVKESWNWNDTVFYSEYENQARFESIQPTADGGYILVATIGLSGNPYLVDYSKISLLKLRSNLTKEWSRQFGNSNPCTGALAVQTSDGGYLVSGTEHTSSYVYTMMMIKTDAYGNIVWE